MATVSWQLRRSNEKALDMAADDYVTAPDDTTLRPDTAVWGARVEPDNVSGQNFIISKYEFGSYGFSLLIESGEYRVDLYTSGGYGSRWATGVSVAAGDSESVMVRYDGDLELLVDDAVVATNTTPSGDITHGTNDFAVGTASDSIGNYGFDGKIDDVFVSNAGATFSDAFAGDATSYNVRYLFDDDLDTSTATDSSGNGNDGTITGASYTTFHPWNLEDRLVNVADCTLAYNRFARSAEVVLDDPDGTVTDEYPRPTPFELWVKRDIDSDYSRRFGGYVSNPKSTQNQAHLELLSHDNWLKSRDVYRSYSSTKKSAILEDLVTDLTPLKWDASRVDVADDEEIDASWSGVSLDSVIKEISASSADEIFGATDTMVFFFEQRDTNRSPRDFTQGEYFADSAEFEEDGKTELNEVTVYYGGDPADEAVRVEDSEAQKALGDDLNSEDPITISDSKTFTDVTTEKVARRKGNEILEGATAIATGKLTTWEAFGVEPGDVARVVVPEQGIDAEFRVAEISHAQLDDTTDIKFAENDDGVVDTLTALSDEVSRVEARPAANDPTIARFTTPKLPFVIDLEVEAYKRTVPDDQLLFGPEKGGWGDERVGGGKWGDQRGDRTQIL